MTAPSGRDRDGRSGETGRRAGLKIQWGSLLVWVRVPPPAPSSCCSVRAAAPRNNREELPRSGGAPPPIAGGGAPPTATLPVRFSFPSRRPVLSHALRDGPALLLGHRPLPLRGGGGKDRDLARLLLAARGRRGRIRQLYRLNGSLYGDKLSLERFLLSPQRFQNSALRHLSLAPFGPDPRQHRADPETRNCGIVYYRFIRMKRVGAPQARRPVRRVAEHAHCARRDSYGNGRRPGRTRHRGRRPRTLRIGRASHRCAADRRPSGRTRAGRSTWSNSTTISAADEPLRARPPG